MDTTFGVGEAAFLRVRHLTRNALTSSEALVPTLESNEENDTLTEVYAVPVPDQPLVRVHWCSAASQEFGLLFLPEANRLFVGAGQVSGVVDLKDSSVVAIEYPLLFWSFERLSDAVVQLGETECLLYDSSGSLLERAAVDPPYEITRLPRRIEFESIVSGSTALELPSGR